MKIRNGFVSNSSSSSFVCDACGTDYDGYDGDYGDIRHLNCCNGHNLCSDCEIGEDTPRLSIEQMREILIQENSGNSGYIKLLSRARDSEITELYTSEFGDEDETDDDSFDDGCDIGVKRCPICQYTEMREIDAINYLLIQGGITKSELLKKMKSDFPNYADLKKFLSQKQGTKF